MGKDSERKSDNLYGIYSEYNNCKGPGLHLVKDETLLKCFLLKLKLFGSLFVL